MDAEKGGCRLRYNSTDLNFFRVFTLFTPDLQLSDAVRAIRPPKLWIFDMDDTLYCLMRFMPQCVTLWRIVWV